MASRREWYRRVNAAWPETVPALTSIEKMTLAQRLYRWALSEKVSAVGTSGNRYTSERDGLLWVNTTHDVKRIVHDLSHHCFWRANPGVSPHDKGHAKLELAMIKEVVRRGYLEGKLAPKPRAPKPPVDPKAEAYRRLLARRSAWERRARRAETALRKLKRQIGALERHHSYLTEGRPHG